MHLQHAQSIAPSTRSDDPTPFECNTTVCATPHICKLLLETCPNGTAMQNADLTKRCPCAAQSSFTLNMSCFYAILQEFATSCFHPSPKTMFFIQTVADSWRQESNAISCERASTPYPQLYKREFFAGQSRKTLKTREFMFFRLPVTSQNIRVPP